MDEVTPEDVEGKTFSGGEGLGLGGKLKVTERLGRGDMGGDEEDEGGDLDRAKQLLLGGSGKLTRGEALEGTAVVAGEFLEVYLARESGIWEALTDLKWVVM